MKSLIFILICFIILNNIYAKDSHWLLTDYVDTKGEFGSKYDIRYLAIDCADSVNCAAAGNLQFRDPIIRATYNGGKNFTTNDWFTAIVDTAKYMENYYPASIADIAYPDTTLCIATADSGYYYISRDKLKTWEKRKLIGDVIYGNDRAFPPYFIYMLDNKRGGITAFREIFLTKDGGENWEKIKLDLDSSIKPTFLDDIYISETNEIKLLGYLNHKTLVLYSTNWGKDWHAHDFTPFTMSKFCFINNNIGWACGYSYDSVLKKNRDIIIHTEDGGATWDKQLDTINLKYNQYDFNAISFMDENNGMVLGAEGYKLWRTSDGGKIWSYDPVSDYVNVPFQNICYVNENFIYAVTRYEKRIYRYKNNTTDVNPDDQVHIKSDLINIYPNPASDYIDINLGRWTPSVRWSPSDLTIYNSLGECVKNLTPTLSEGEGARIDVSGLPPGMYYMKYGTYINKFVKM
jgi:photosystem II stability/assembly factor-like uncharacterized protein